MHDTNAGIGADVWRSVCVVTLDGLEKMSAPRTSRIAMQLLSLGLMAWGITGCGGGSGQAVTVGGTSTNAAQTSAPATSTPATTELAPGAARFIANTGAICRRRGPEVEAAEIYTESVAAIIAAARTRASVEREGLRELEALTPPSSIAGAWRSYIADAKGALADLTKLAHSGANPARAPFEAVYAAYFKILEVMRAEARQAGLAGCAQYG